MWNKWGKNEEENLRLWEPLTFDTQKIHQNASKFKPYPIIQLVRYQIDKFWKYIPIYPHHWVSHDTVRSTESSCVHGGSPMFTSYWYNHIQ